MHSLSSISNCVEKTSLHFHFVRKARYFDYFPNVASERRGRQQQTGAQTRFDGAADDDAYSFANNANDTKKSGVSQEKLELDREGRLMLDSKDMIKMMSWIKLQKHPRSPDPIT